MKRRALCLCLEDPARFLWPEALVHHARAETWKAHRAGTRLAGHVYPVASAAPAEIGIAHLGRARSMEEFCLTAFGLVITACGPAAARRPTRLGRRARRPILVPPPARSTGFEVEARSTFRTVLDDLRREASAVLQASASQT